MSRLSHAFTLVEIALALGIIGFALLSVLALLPLGMRNNQVSKEETQAAGILTTLVADLEGSYAGDSSAVARSRRFKLNLPYQINSAGRLEVNTNLLLNTLTADYSTGVSQSEVPVAIAAAPVPVFQASVIYTRIPAANNAAPVEARVIVNWPCLNTSNVAHLTDPAKVSGFVETYVTFPAP